VDRLDPATGRVRHYGRTEGLANDYVTAAYCDARGGLWFGSYAGIFHLRDAPEAPDDPPPVAVTGLRVAGDRFPVLELGQVTVGPLLLDPEQRDIGIDFLSVSRRGTAGVLYQYTNDGGGTWSLPSPERTVNFARLPPGLYQFAVRAVTANRTVSRVPATVVFTIRPPVWRRWWARTAMAVVLAGLLLGLHRYRVRRLVEVERLRTAIAADLHDEVATNLSSIATFATLVRGGLETPSPLLDRITVLATESVDAIREIIWSVDPKPETVASLLLRLHDALATSCRSRGIHLAVDAPSEQFGGNLTAAQRKHLWLLLKEAVSNACRHSNATTVRVTASRAGRRVRFTVADNGTGFAPGAGSTGRGLTTMQSRAASLGGALTIAAGAEGGTTVQFVTDRLD
jgi:signal transduction histidine kinase